jgi:hypothetical protein
MYARIALAMTYDAIIMKYRNASMAFGRHKRNVQASVPITNVITVMKTTQDVKMIIQLKLAKVIAGKKMTAEKISASMVILEHHARSPVKKSGIKNMIATLIIQLCMFVKKANHRIPLIMIVPKNALLAIAQKRPAAKTAINIPARMEIKHVTATTRHIPVQTASGRKRNASSARTASAQKTPNVQKGT